jgi:predicted Na+-dependent transporter
MKWSNSGLIGVLGAKNLGFGFALAEICQTFGQQQCEESMACPKSDPQSLHNMVTSLIGAIWRK